MYTVLLLLAVSVFTAGIVLAVIALIRDIIKKPARIIRRIYINFLIAGSLLFIVVGGNNDPGTILLLGGLFFILLGILIFVIGLVRLFMKRPMSKVCKTVAILCVVCGAIAFCVSLKPDLLTLVILLALLFLAAVPVMLTINLIFLLVLKKQRKVKWVFILMNLCAGIGLFIVANGMFQTGLGKGEREHEIHEVEIQTNYDFAVEDGNEPVEIISSTGFDNDISSYHCVYDRQDIPLLQIEDPVSAGMCIEAIQNNPDIREPYRSFFCDFTNRIAKKYPDADLAILYHNLDTLEVHEVNQMDYVLKSLDWNSYGCYRTDENIIYIPKGTVYTEGEWGFQVILHEFCHAARTSWYEDREGIHCRLDFNADEENVLLEECMNSVFSCSLLNYEEKDIAYQMPSNYLRIMLECMDNYELSDYMNHGDTYFLRKLDEASGYTNYAQVIWKLITLQRTDWQNDQMDIAAAEYEPIYEFLGELYYGKYLTEDMSDQEAHDLAEELTEKAFYDAPEGYKINKDYFYDYLDVFRKHENMNRS